MDDDSMHQAVTIKAPGQGSSGILSSLVAMLLLAALLFPLPAQAVIVEGLHQARVAVENTGSESRSQGFVKGLKQVLVRVTGSDRVLSHQDIASLTNRAESLVEEYSYRDLDGNLTLEMRFDGSSVTRQLAELEQSVWGANRPGVLAWVVVDDRAGRQLIKRGSDGDNGDDTDARAWRQDLVNAAELRGLPLLLPRYDSSERNQLSLSEIWGQFMEPIREMSRPYRADRLAVVRIAARGDTLQARWQLQVRGESAMEQGNLSAGSKEELMDKLVAEWARQFAAVYGVDPSALEDAQRLEMRIDGVSSLADYASVRSALMRMEPVESAEPVGVRHDQLQVRVRFAGEVRTLEEYVALDRRFEVVEQAPEDNDRPDMGNWLAAGQPIPQETIESDSFASLYPTLQYRWVVAERDSRDVLEAIEPLNGDSEETPEESLGDDTLPGF
ncbi:MAG: DUF2066 domain-containing protein [Halomonadaceae bacterium]|nr:MAG: DUF2066 domain-containing protein [Halomonadaceae bacterium]